MTVRCFKSVFLNVKQKDIPEADTFHEMQFRISSEAFISCAYFISGRRITFFGRLGVFFLSGLRSCCKMGPLRIPTISCASVPNTLGPDFRQVSSGWNFTQWCPESPGFEAWHPWKVAEHLPELGVKQVLKRQFKTSGDALIPALPFIFLGGTWSFYSCDCVVFQYIKPSILWHPRGTWLLLGCNTHCPKLCCQAVS